MREPEYFQGIVCPACHRKDTVSLILNKDTPQEDYVQWCCCGIVTVNSSSGQIHKQVFDFKQEPEF